MKLYLLALFVALVGGTFVDFLESLKNHSSFQRLPPSDKLLFGELVVAAENNELTELIDRVGLVPVLKLMDHMSQYDAEKFAAYLAEHSNYTHHAPDHGDVINRRDDHDHHSSLYNYLHGLSSSLSNLPNAEKAIMDGLMAAAEQKQVTQYIQSVGYGAIFGLLEFAGHSHANQVTRLIESALASEAAPPAKVKRQGHSHSHHNNFVDYFSNLGPEYYDKLPEQERQTYHALLDAANANNLTAYIQANGYGPIFGLIEHLDYVHANQVYDYLTKALEAEAAAAGN